MCGVLGRSGGDCVIVARAGFSSGCTQGVRACVRVRGHVCFFNVHVCQVRDQPWLGQPTLAFLSLVLAWAVAMFWGEERSL